MNLFDKEWEWISSEDFNSCRMHKWLMLSSFQMCYWTNDDLLIVQSHYWIQSRESHLSFFVHSIIHFNFLFKSILSYHINSDHIADLVMITVFRSLISFCYQFINSICYTIFWYSYFHYDIQHWIDWVIFRNDIHEWFPD